MALLAAGRRPVSLILRENNRFNDTLARLETAAPAEERALIQAIRGAQDDAMATVADIANAVRDRRLADAHDGAAAPARSRSTRRSRTLVGSLVAAEEARMASLRASIASAQERSLRRWPASPSPSVAVALIGGFVISWSFILPGARVPRLPEPGGRGALRGLGRRAEPRRVRRARRAHELDERRAPPPRRRAAGGGRHAPRAERPPRDGQPRQVGIPGEHEPRAAHAR